MSGRRSSRKSSSRKKRRSSRSCHGKLGSKTNPYKVSALKNAPGGKVLYYHDCDGNLMRYSKYGWKDHCGKHVARTDEVSKKKYELEMAERKEKNKCNPCKMKYPMLGQIKKCAPCKSRCNPCPDRVGETMKGSGYARMYGGARRRKRRSSSKKKKSSSKKKRSRGRKRRSSRKKKKSSSKKKRSRGRKRRSGSKKRRKSCKYGRRSSCKRKSGPKKKRLRK